jgi:hypothetical protein
MVPPMRGRGFEFAETMSGTWQPDEVGAAERPLSFTVRARAPSLRQHLRDGVAELHGTIDAEGLATGAEVTGTLTIRPMRERAIRYDLGFRGDDGKSYRLIGQKDLRASRPLASVTTLPAHIVDDAGRPLATCQVRFRLRDQLVPFLSSWRLA